MGPYLCFHAVEFIRIYVQNRCRPAVGKHEKMTPAAGPRYFKIDSKYKLGTLSVPLGQNLVPGTHRMKEARKGINRALAPYLFLSKRIRLFMKF